MPPKKTFSISSALGYGFKAVFDNFGIIFITVLLIGILRALVILIGFGANLKVFWPLLRGITALRHDPDAFRTVFYLTPMMKFTFYSFIIIFVYQIIKSFLMVGFVKILLDLHSKGKSKIEILFCCFNLAIKYFVAKIFYTILVILGLVFFVVPGIYFYIRYRFYYLYIIVKNVVIFDSFLKSAELTKGHKMELFGLYLVYSIIYLLVPFTYGISLMIIWPASILTEIYCFKNL